MPSRKTELEARAEKIEQVIHILKRVLQSIYRELLIHEEVSKCRKAREAKSLRKS